MGNSTYSEDDYIQINALQHYVFCPRQCALIHIEDIWQENLFTVRGDLLHAKADSDSYESRGAIKTVRGLRIQSRRLGLSGRCDVVEFHQSRGGKAPPQVLPVEFKSGKPKEDISDKAQLCAQVLCLEEMLNTQISTGVFFYGRIRRRVRVPIDEALRRQTENLITAVHALVNSRRIPGMAELQNISGLTAASFQRRCRNCSLQSACQPKALNERRLQNYMKELYSP